MSSSNSTQRKKTLYDVLGVQQSATDEEIRQAYRSLALKHHPDRHAPEQKAEAEEKFKTINDAYNILRDPARRQTYDTRGEDAARQSEQAANAGAANAAPFDPFNLFANMFNAHGQGQSFRFQQQQGSSHQAPPPPIQHKVQLTLEEMYNGARKRIRINCNVPCEDCKGSGIEASLAEEVKSRLNVRCKDCNGNRVRVQTIQIGPFLQQSTQPCATCEGTGEQIPVDARCSHCNGDKIVVERKTHDIEVKIGTRQNDYVLLKGEGDYIPSSFNHPQQKTPDASSTRGDVAIVFQQGKEHPLFRRANEDLYMAHELTLAEALCGFEFTFTHLDNRKIKVKSSDVSECIRPGDTRTIANEGMPLVDNPTRKGTLHIQFQVAFPRRREITSTIAQALLKHLPGTPPSGSDQDPTPPANEYCITD